MERLRPTRDAWASRPLAADQPASQPAREGSQYRLVILRASHRKVEFKAQKNTVESAAKHY
jgi:hypothetical protein